MVSPVSSPLSGESPWVDWYPHRTASSSVPRSAGSLHALTPAKIALLCQSLSAAFLVASRVYVDLPCPCRRLRRGKLD